MRTLPTIAVACVLALASMSLGAHGGEQLDLLHADSGAEPLRVSVQLRFDGEATAEGADRSTAINGARELTYFQSRRQADGRLVRVVDREDGKGSDVFVASDAGDRITVGAIDGPIPRQQVDLLQHVADPLDVSLILPTEAVADGVTWRVPEPNVQRLMRLDEVASADVVGIVSDVTAGHVRIRFSGPVSGVVEGAKVELEARGVALFDRAERRITQANLAWHERREIGPATPAVNLRVKLNVSIALAKSDGSPTPSVVEAATAAEVDHRLRLVTGDRRWAVLSSRDWFVIAADPNATTLRYLVDGELGAVTTLSTDSSGRRAGVDWHESVADSLRGAAIEIGPAVDFPTQPGVTVTEVASSGQLNGAAVVWLHHRIEGLGGVLVATTSAPADQAEASRVAVRELIATIRELPTEVAAGRAARVSQ